MTKTQNSDFIVIENFIINKEKIKFAVKKDLTLFILMIDETPFEIIFEHKHQLDAAHLSLSIQLDAYRTENFRNPMVQQLNHCQRQISWLREDIMALKKECKNAFKRAAKEIK